MRILYLDLDALTPSHLGCYGYHRNTSPQIDKLANEGVRFTNFYCSDAPCLPSRSAFYSGQFGIHSGVVGHGGTAADRRLEGVTRSFSDRLASEGFPATMQKHGLKTAMISPFGQRHSAWHFYAGFNEIHNTGGGGMESAEKVTPQVMKWLDDNADQDSWYLHINYWDIHTPYRAPASYGDPFADEPLPAWITPEVLEKHVATVGPHTAQEISMWHDKEMREYPRHPGGFTDMAGLRKMIDGYDTAIRYVDDQIGLIIEKLKALGIYEDMAIVISADHGENMGELGIYGEHGTADNATCNIPMIMRWPNAKQGTVDQGLHYHLDTAPTFADLLGYDAPPLWDGQSFAQTITEGKNTSRDDLVISQCAHVCQRSVRYKNWLYVRTYHDGYRLYPKEMLFDLENDPHEQNDLATKHPEICLQAAYRLMNWHDDMMATMPYDTDPLWTVMKENGPMHTWGALADYCNRLEATGRAEGAKQLREKYAYLLEQEA